MNAARFKMELHGGLIAELWLGTPGSRQLAAQQCVAVCSQAVAGVEALICFCVLLQNSLPFHNLITYSHSIDSP